MKHRRRSSRTVPSKFQFRRRTFTRLNQTRVSSAPELGTSPQLRPRQTRRLRCRRKSKHQGKLSALTSSSQTKSDSPTSVPSKVQAPRKAVRADFIKSDQVRLADSLELRRSGYRSLFMFHLESPIVASNKARRGNNKQEKEIHTSTKLRILLIFDLFYFRFSDFVFLLLFDF